MINNAVLMGRITATPELKTTTSGTEVCSFSIAVERNYAKKREERETDFINIVTWRGTAKFVSTYFQKGDMIAVQGEIQTRKYEDKNGNKRTAFEVVAQNVSFCGGKREEQKMEQTDNIQEPKIEQTQPDFKDYVEAFQTTSEQAALYSAQQGNQYFSKSDKDLDEGLPF